jgi:3-hydroxyethyl bacteriochlorophyllide a dehydrogenase
MKGKAVVFKKPLKVSLEEISIPEPQAGEILFRTIYSGISPGTETRMLKGSANNTENMFPFIPGYSTVGAVIKKGRGVSLALGDRVYSVGCDFYKKEVNSGWGGHLEYAVVNEKDVVRLPKNIDPIAATLSVVAAVGYHGALRCGPVKGKTVGVVGQGPVGFFCAQFLQQRGAAVVALDLHDIRLKAARAAGIKRVINTSKGGLEGALKKQYPEGLDIVVEVTGIPAMVKEAGKILKARVAGGPYPLLVLLASYSGDICLDYLFAFQKEPNILPCRNPTPAERQKVLRMIARNQVNTKALKGEVFDPKDAPAAYDRVMNHKDTILTAVFKWS